MFHLFQQSLLYLPDFVDKKHYNPIKIIVDYLLLAERTQLINLRLILNDKSFACSHRLAL